MPSSAPSPRLATHLVLLALLPVAVFAVWVAVLVWLIGSLAGTAEWVDHTDQVLAGVSRLESRAFGEIVAVRGYLVTGSDSFLRGFQAPHDVERTASALRSLVQDNSPQQERVTAFRNAWRAWRDVADAEIAARQSGGDVARMMREQAEPLEQTMRRVADEMRGEEERLRIERVRRASTMRRRTLLATTVAGLALGGILAALGVRELRRVAADYEVTHASLRAEAAKLADAEHQLREYATELEQRVARRTEELAGANAQLEAFGYSVSHDLRAPLRGMQGLAQALLEDYGPRLDATGQDYARRIVAEAASMDALIQDLLAYSRLTRVELAMENVKVRDALDIAIRNVEAEAAAAGATIDARVGDETVVANRTVLAQVITNLLSNAIKFGGAAPQIDVGTEPVDGAVRLFVVDPGIGIEPEHQGRIFGVFERLHGSEQYPGTGIGLATVKKGVERMGGSVGVESKPGEGSRFWIVLQKGPTT